MDSSAHNSSNASVASSDQVIPRFFLGERERRVSSVAIFVTTTHAYGKNHNKKAWNGTGELLHERVFWHGASFTRAETTSGR